MNQNNVEPSIVQRKGISSFSSCIQRILNSGFFLGIVCAVFYSVASIYLRKLTELDSPYALTMFLKESVASLFALPFVLFGLFRGTVSLKQWRLWVLMFTIAVIMQIFGNLGTLAMFTAAGIAISLSCIWSGGLLAGQLFDLVCIKEKFRPMLFVALLVVILAVCCIGVGLGLRSETSSAAMRLSFWGTIGIVLSGLIIGTINSLDMAAIKYSAQYQVPFWVPILLVPGAGTVVLGAYCFWLYGGEIASVLSFEQLRCILFAGVTNLIAFCALVKGLDKCPIAFMNLMNAAQIAIGALAGIFWFNEPTNVYIYIGIGLTIVAIFLANRPKES